MRKQLWIFSSTAALAVVLQAFVGGAALAHHPEITAEAVCDIATGNVVINYTATAWEGTGDPASRENPMIDILINGVFVTTGAFMASDYSFSGSEPKPSGSGPGDSVTVTAVAVGVWGNLGEPGGSASTAVVLPSEDCAGAGLGRFTGGGHQLRVDGVRVTRGLTVHCDLLLSNNLEVNWSGNQFHMTEHLTTVECSDDPDITQAPPDAPLDTLRGVGAGRYNGADGYTIEFTLVDAGEPGREDMAALLIYETADPSNVVLNVPLQLLDGGNLQAHEDQPHR